MRKLPKAVFITGTDTGVGKTVVTAALAGLLEKKGMDVGVIKPFQTGTELHGLCDAGFVYRFLGREYDLPDVSPCRLKAPLSPYFAAVAEGVNIDLQEVLQHTREYISGHDITLVEGAGGICVPITADFMMADLAVAVGAAATVLVLRPGLGTLNHTALSLKYAKDKGLSVMGGVINGFPDPPDIASATNPIVLRDVFSMDIMGILPEFEGLSVEGGISAGLGDSPQDFFCRSLGGIFSARDFLHKLRLPDPTQFK